MGGAPRAMLDFRPVTGGALTVPPQASHQPIAYRLTNLAASILAAMSVLSLSMMGCDGNDIPKTTISALESAERYELLSLNPDRATDPDHAASQPTSHPADDFHGWRVLGRTTVADAPTRKRLNDALRAGARESDGTAERCFNPRHGVRVVRGDRIVDLVICFECLQVRVIENDQQSEGFLVSESPQAVFDDVLRSAGIPLADKAR